MFMNIKFVNGLNDTLISTAISEITSVMLLYCIVCLFAVTSGDKITHISFQKNKNSYCYNPHHHQRKKKKKTTKRRRRKRRNKEEEK